MGLPLHSRLCVSWSQFTQAPGTPGCRLGIWEGGATPSVEFSWPRWDYSQDRNWQMIELGLFSPESQLLDISNTTLNRLHLTFFEGLCISIYLCFIKKICWKPLNERKVRCAQNWMAKWYYSSRDHLGIKMVYLDSCFSSSPCHAFPPFTFISSCSRKSVFVCLSICDVHVWLECLVRFILQNQNHVASWVPSLWFPSTKHPRDSRTLGRKWETSYFSRTLKNTVNWTQTVHFRRESQLFFKKYSKLRELISMMWPLKDKYM